ncbi:MAG TPA: hypothetical protein VFM12_04920 [Gemmatimonadales bacterium]|jgi:hypothetical protein|nr:hypothetical protein [Gemmatimonadales bacterium]
MKRALAVLAALLVACGKGKPAAEHAAALHTAADSAEMDATVLGREIYHLLDLASDYRGSHRGRLPRSLRDLGTDSLTNDIARSVNASGPEFTAGAAFREPAGHFWVRCSGELKVLEDAVIGAGRYTLTCTSPSGESREVQAGGALD